MTENDANKDFVELVAEVENPSRSKEVTVKLNNSNGSYTFKYAPLDAILTQIRPILKKHNFGLMQTIEHLEGGAWLTTKLRHTSGQIFASSLPFPANIDARAQDYGGRLTYFKRYGLCMALGIAAEDDTDAQDSKGKYTKGQIKTQVGNYVTSIAKSQNMTELLRVHGDFKEVLEYAKIYFPDEIYEKSGDGMCAQEYFEFLYKSFRDNKTSNRQMDEAYRNTVGK